jgi:hypothetical protein
MTFVEWSTRWIESYRPPQVSKRCWENYQTHRFFIERLRDPLVRSIGMIEILELRRDLEIRYRTQTVASYGALCV